MALRLGIADKKVWVYRDKWRAISLAFMAFFVCISVAFAFYNLTAHQAAFGVFSVAFGLVGLAMLIRMPALAKNIFSDDGAMLLVGDICGLTVTQGLGAEPMSFPWNSVDEILLAEKLRLVDADETTYLRHTLIIFLSPTDAVNTNWLDRLKSGISRTNQGRLYVLSAYPAREHQALMSALTRVAPTPIFAKYESWLRFDTVTGVMSTRTDRS
jgi:hypothetical protein